MDYRRCGGGGVGRTWRAVGEDYDGFVRHRRQHKRGVGGSRYPDLLSVLYWGVGGGGKEKGKLDTSSPNAGIPMCPRRIRSYVISLFDFPQLRDHTSADVEMISLIACDGLIILSGMRSKSLVSSNGSRKAACV